MVRTFQVPILTFMQGSNVPSSYLDIHAWFERSKFLSLCSCMVERSKFLSWCSCIVRTFQVPVFMFMHGLNVPSSYLDVHAWFERSKFLSLCSCMVRTFQVPILMFMHGSNVPSSYLRFQSSHAQPTVISYINFQERVDLNLSHRLGLLISTCIFFATLILSTIEFSSRFSNNVLIWIYTKIFKIAKKQFLGRYILN